jgi:hypothetical protein
MISLFIILDIAQNQEALEEFRSLSTLWTGRLPDNSTGGRGRTGKIRLEMQIFDFMGYKINYFA